MKENEPKRRIEQVLSDGARELHGRHLAFNRQFWRNQMLLASFLSGVFLGSDINRYATGQNVSVVAWCIDSLLPIMAVTSAVLYRRAARKLWQFENANVKHGDWPDEIEEKRGV